MKYKTLLALLLIACCIICSACGNTEGKTSSVSVDSITSETTTCVSTTGSNLNTTCSTNISIESDPASTTAKNNKSTKTSQLVPAVTTTCSITTGSSKITTASANSSNESVTTTAKPGNTSEKTLTSSNKNVQKASATTAYSHSKTSINYEVASSTSSAEEALPTSHRIRVKNIMQKPELPMGCEIVSLTIVLNRLKYDVDKMYMAENYLDRIDFWEENGELYGADPYLAFPGDPANPFSSGCFSPVIVNSANRFLYDNNSEYTCINTSKMPLQDLFHTYIDNGVPVIIWITGRDLHEIEYHNSWKTQKGNVINFPSYQHCVVMTGYDTKKKLVYVADPLVGNTSYDMELFDLRFQQLGSESAVVIKKKIGVDLYE